MVNVSQTPEQPRQSTKASDPSSCGRQALHDASGLFAPWDAGDAGRNQRPHSTHSQKFTTTQSAPEQQYPAHLQAIIERAMAGDQTVLSELKKALDEYPEWTQLFGDMFENARQNQLQLLVGHNLLFKEAIVRNLDKLRGELIGGGVTAHERLLIDRVCLDWLAVQVFDTKLSNAMIDKPSTHPTAKATSQLLDAASRRFNNGLKTLATIRKLLRPTPSTLELLRQPAAATKLGAGGTKRDVIPASEGVPIEN